jgi:pimeloyl-ACP methyl ester carboxylesterase
MPQGRLSRSLRPMRLADQCLQLPFADEDRSVTPNTVSVAGIDLELTEFGTGAPLLMLHGAGGFDPRHSVNALLAERRRLICPSHPGFGRSALPDWLDSVDDIAHVYLELMDLLGLPTVELMGCSVGGWIAAEMATKTPERFTKLVFVGPVGVKTGSADRLDVPDIFALPSDELNRLLFRDPKKMVRDPAALSDDELTIVVRNRETLALIAWEPYMHNPKLKHRLHRAGAPALFLRGDSDGLVSDEYLRAYARLLPKARIATIAEAGHAPHLEQPEAFAAAVLAFLDD